MAALGLGATELDDGGGEGEWCSGEGWCEEEPLDRVDRDTRLKEIMQTVHDDGHEGVQRTLHRLRRDFHFPNMRKLVQDLVRSCVVC